MLGGGAAFAAGITGVIVGGLQYAGYTAAAQRRDKTNDLEDGAAAYDEAVAFRDNWNQWGLALTLAGGGVIAAGIAAVTVGAWEAAP